MTAVEGGELSLAQALDDRDHRGVDEAKPQVDVLGEQLAHADVISAHQVDDGDRTVCDIVKKRREGSLAKAVTGEPIQLDNHRSGNEQLLEGAGEKARTDFVVGIGSVHRCVERTGVADQRHDRGT